jgi:hypothetical protein
MVTKGYQKGVYERVTKGTGGGVPIGEIQLPEFLCFTVGSLGVVSSSVK